MARTVEDIALLTEAIAGHDPRDATSIDAPAPRLRDALDAPAAGLRIGLPREYLEGEIDPEVRAAVDRAAAILRDAGATIADVSLPHTRYALPAYYVIAPAEASSNLARYDGVRYGLRAGDRKQSLIDLYQNSRGAGFGPEVKRRIMLGTFALRSGYYDAYYRKAQQVRALIKRDFDDAFGAVDAILSPVAPGRRGGSARRRGRSTCTSPTSSPCRATWPASPASACRRLLAAGLPLGVQLVGRALDEATLIRGARAIERGAAVSTRRPE